MTLQKCDNTLEALWATGWGHRKPVTWPQKLSEKVAPSCCARSCPERGREGCLHVCGLLGLGVLPVFLCVCVRARASMLQLLSPLSSKFTIYHL